MNEDGGACWIKAYLVFLFRLGRQVSWCRSLIVGKGGDTLSSPSCAAVTNVLTTTIRLVLRSSSAAWRVLPESHFQAGNAVLK